MALAFDRDSVLGIQLETVNGGNWVYDEEVGHSVFQPYQPDSPPQGYMNAYEVTLGFGGHEEGGWWFDISEPLSSIKFWGEKEARRAYYCLYDNLAEIYEVRSPRSNTNGEDLVIVAEKKFATYKPEVAPHYE